MANDFITQQSLDDFHKAKNRARMHSLFDKLTWKNPDLMSLYEVTSIIKPKKETYLGMKTIEIDRIIGSEGRYRDGQKPRRRYREAAHRALGLAHLEGLERAEGVRARAYGYALRHLVADADELQQRGRGDVAEGPRYDRREHRNRRDAAELLADRHRNRGRDRLRQQRHVHRAAEAEEQAVSRGRPSRGSAGRRYISRR